MNTSDPTSVPIGREVREVPVPGTPYYVHPEWARDLPWLVQGTTGRGGDGRPADFGLFAEASAPRVVMESWSGLQSWARMPGVVHARQVHEAEVRTHAACGEGMRLTPACDGHATAEPGLLLAVTTADCVPVSLVDPVRRVVAMLHAGWRSAAGGILERGVAVLAGLGAEPARLRVHLGPAICGRCYEVGPEVFQALGLPAPEGPQPVDLRAALAARAVGLGVPPEAVTTSAHCTLCGDGLFYSHRGGDGARQVGFVGVRP